MYNHNQTIVIQSKKRQNDQTLLYSLPNKQFENFPNNALRLSCITFNLVIFDHKEI